MSTDGLEGSASFDSEEEDVVPVKDDFVIHNPPLGEGGRAKVYLCEYIPSGDQYAMKITKKRGLTLRQRHSIVHEVQVMEACDHPGIVGLAAAFENDEEVILVLELMEGGDLFDALITKKKFTEEEARQVTQALLTALEYLHARGIVHRDLKPENILLADPDDYSSVKLADFGFAKFLGPSGNLITPCGTPGYYAPEIAKSEAYKAGVDMWSTGVVLYMLLCGIPPFHESDDGSMLRAIAEGDYSFPEEYWKDVSPEAIDFLSHLLETDPAKRYTAQQAMEHPWVKGVKVKRSLIPRRSYSEDILSKVNPSADFRQMMEMMNRALEVKKREAISPRSAASIEDNELWKSRQVNKVSDLRDEVKKEKRLAKSDSGRPGSPWLRMRKTSSVGSSGLGRLGSGGVKRAPALLGRDSGGSVVSSDGAIVRVDTSM